MGGLICSHWSEQDVLVSNFALFDDHCHFTEVQPQMDFKVLRMPVIALAIILYCTEIKTTVTKID